MSKNTQNLEIDFFLVLSQPFEDFTVIFIGPAFKISCIYDWYSILCLFSQICSSHFLNLHELYVHLIVFYNSSGKRNVLIILI